MNTKKTFTIIAIALVLIIGAVAAYTFQNQSDGSKPVIASTSNISNDTETADPHAGLGVCALIDTPSIKSALGDLGGTIQQSPATPVEDVGTLQEQTCFYYLSSKKSPSDEFKITLTKYRADDPPHAYSVNGGESVDGVGEIAKYSDSTNAGEKVRTQTNQTGTVSSNTYGLNVLQGLNLYSFQLVTSQKPDSATIKAALITIAQKAVK